MSVRRRLGVVLMAGLAALAIVVTPTAAMPASRHGPLHPLLIRRIEHP
ncbi:hypothetical protein [Amycolatopsis pigmentata]|uniref:Uncharacterized protein n=1 Tax=Amycolatopsis pigmentata TaxID=450801 RepID=A0ABW5G062_9PSEU